MFGIWRVCGLHFRGCCGAVVLWRVLVQVAARIVKILLLGVKLCDLWGACNGGLLWGPNPAFLISLVASGKFRSVQRALVFLETIRELMEFVSLWMVILCWGRRLVYVPPKVVDPHLNSALRHSFFSLSVCNV